MTRSQMIANLRRARALVRAVHETTDLPQIQLTLRHADQNLHWALWNLGQIDELRPDLPGSIVANAPPRRKAKPKPRKRGRTS